MKTKLYVGFNKRVSPPKKGLYIHDEIPNIKLATVFDPNIHCFNPLKDIDYKKARELADVLYTIYPQGEDTLTVRGGRRALARLLQKFSRLDKIETMLWKKAEAHASDKKNNEPLSPMEAEVLGLVSDILLSPVLRRVLCSRQNFSFNTDIILARINRAELGEFDALVLGFFLMAQFKSTVCVPDGGFYLRNAHISLIRENRLIAGINTLAELTPRLRQAVLLIKDKVPSGTTFEDAETLARYSRLAPGTNGFNDFVAEALG